MRSLSDLIAALRRDERGAVALTYLLLLPLIVLMLIGSLDFIRYSTAQGKLQNALDAAVISAGRRLDTFTPTSGSADETQWKQETASYFTSNVPDGYLNSTIAAANLNIGYNDERDASGFITIQYVAMNISASLPLLTTGLMERASFPLAAANKAERRARSDLEVVLAMDNSGSMAYSSRMVTLKSAAKQLVASLFKAADSGEDDVAKNEIDIGIVPFTGTVRIGDKEQALKWLNASWLTNSIVKIKANYLQNIWSGCIAEPAMTESPMPADVLTPDDGFQPLFLTYSYDYTPSGKTPTELVSFDAPSSPQTYDRRVWAEIKGSAIRVHLAVESEYCTEAPAIFLSADQDKIDSAIDSMESYGDTGVPVGLLWAWRMLSPEWRGERGWGDDVMPRDPAVNLSKIIVLLSDGDNRPLVNNWSYGYSEGSDIHASHTANIAKYSLVYKYKQGDTELQATENDLSLTIPKFRQCPVNPLKMYDPLDPPATSVDNDACLSLADADTDIGYHTGYNSSWYKEDLRRGKLTTSAYDGFMGVLCQRVKNDGNDIKVYTITLSTDVSANGVSVMRNCASGTNYYYSAENVADLPAVFDAIANSLTELRLTE